MTGVQELLSLLTHPDELIAWGGYLGLALIVFAETGLLAGFFLPGDSLLVTAGLVASWGRLDYLTLNALLIFCAVAGDTVGYWIGYYTGPKIFRREDSFFFRRSHLERTHRFFEKHGGKTIILARFVPIVRTFAPTVAGAGRMSYGKFLSYNVFGGIFWVLGMTSVGFFLGRSIPDIDRHLHLVIAVVVAVSFLPIFFEWFRSRGKTSKSV
ncbi:MAG: VTT domain-containing protein [Candidatus Omnitrophica bacterium]|nr:VTT domain-containing protein [Candidatus Omnitrophota bacterium]